MHKIDIIRLRVSNEVGFQGMSLRLLIPNYFPQISNCGTSFSFKYGTDEGM